MNRKEQSEQMQELVSKWHNSDLTQIDFAKLHNIKLHKFRYWISRSRKVNGVPEGFIELNATTGGQMYLRYPNGVELYLSTQTPVSYIKALIKI
jgi:hypothetical protein